MNDIPYRYLQISNNPLIDNFSQGKDLKKLFTYSDKGCRLLKPEIKDFFISKNLIPEVGNLWTRPPNKLPKYYHTDRVRVTGEPNIEVAVNWLLDGEPGITRWCYSALDNKVLSGGMNESGIRSDWYEQKSSPEFSTVLNNPMLIRVDIPHTVDTRGTESWRLSYSLRFKNDPTWEYCLEQLKNIIGN
jgi:hypothetical protein